MALQKKKLKTTVALPCDLEANNNDKHDDESGVEPVPGPSQYGASEQVGDDDMAIITEEVEEDIIIQVDASEFDAEVEVEEIDEIYVSDEEPPADTSSVEIISLSLITIRNKVITKLPNSEQSYKGKVKTHNYINRQNQLTTGKL